MSTSLSNMTRKNAFNVPEGYFEGLPTAVLSKCSDSKVKKRALLTSKPLWWSVAACSFLLLGIWFVVPNTTPSSESLLAENDFYVSEIWTDFLAQNVCQTIIEDELFASNIELSLFFEDIFIGDFLDDYDYFLSDHIDLFFVYEDFFDY